ncbi:baeRF3 domain-containing protein [Facklamia miroungae]|uniref:Bacterial archaeo-eukaryotic release factor family 8 domain-containing protein n=1 Tax=Facklamia miroungae TaxID=120956 RepID=A0A1G7RP66_9LACT|nr:hypothetical protein [Facklamia miroungae]NKZ29338.1 hypothetical protein [Facklamia miroungae]SDG12404.1 hypothetical protein SAMN05421791_103116 [Facklamia miroungae]
MGHSFVKDLRELQNKEEALRLSIYMPTNRGGVNRQEDLIQFKNLVQEIKPSLEELKSEAGEKILNELERLRNDKNFWDQTKEGLALFISPKEFEVAYLRSEFKPAVYLEKEYYLLPLLAYYEELNEVIIADISKDAVSLFDANQFNSEPLALDGDIDIKQFSEIYDDLDPDSQVNVHSYGGRQEPGMHHGHRATPEEKDLDRGKYFTYLNKKMHELSKHYHRPILLAGTVENLGHYQKVNGTDSIYFEKTIDKPFQSIDSKEKTKVLKEILSQDHQSFAQDKINQIEKARNQGKVAHDFEKIKDLIKEGRIEEWIIQYHTDYLLQEEDLNHWVLKAMNQGTKIALVLEKVEGIKQQFSAIMRF